MKNSEFNNVCVVQAVHPDGRLAGLPHPDTGQYRVNSEGGREG